MVGMAYCETLTIYYKIVWAWVIARRKGKRRNPLRVSGSDKPTGNRKGNWNTVCQTILPTIEYLREGGWKYETYVL